jgi:hypothetical protein
MTMAHVEMNLLSRDQFQVDFVGAGATEGLYAYV